MTTHVQETLPFPWQAGRQCSMQLLIQPWICAPGTQYGWVDRGSVEYEVCPTLLHMANTGNRTPDLLILSPTPYPLGHMLPTRCNSSFCADSQSICHICCNCSPEAAALFIWCNINDYMLEGGNKHLISGISESRNMSTAGHHFGSLSF